MSALRYKIHLRQKGEGEIDERMKSMSKNEGVRGRLIKIETQVFSVLSVH